MSQTTRERLDRHHGGEQFRDMMLESFHNRFNEAFWQEWAAHVAPTLAESPTLVDLGCGPGLMLEAWRARYPEAALHGVEYQPYMLKAAREVAERSGAHLHNADLHTLKLDLPDGSVDAILLAMVIHEMGEPVGLLREIRRLLKPDGKLFFIDWVRAPLTRYLQGFEGDPFDEAMSAQDRIDRFDHFMEHNKFSVEDVNVMLSRLGFEGIWQEVRSEGQFVRLVART